MSAPENTITTAASGAEMRARATGVVFVAQSPDRMALSASALLEQTPFDVVVGVLYPLYIPTFNALAARHGDRLNVRTVGSVSQLINETYEQRHTSLIVIDDAVVLPPDPFATALQWIDDDLRVATVSFLSNASGSLSFPTRNHPEDRAPDGQDEVSITRRLRSLSPAAKPTPITYATGAVVILSAGALSAVGNLEAPASARFDIAVADFSARSRAKGFVDLVDTSTYILRPSDVAVDPIAGSVVDPLTPDDRGWLLHRHRSLIGFVDSERTASETPFALAHQVAAVKVRGIRVLIDGSCFGPNEVGTQVATSHTIRALSTHPDVREVCVALPGAVPQYAAATLTGPKVRAQQAAAHELGVFGAVDVAFRPYQAVPGWPLDAWRAAAPRFGISILDTIAFHNGGYFADSGQWMAYRAAQLEAVRAADFVTVISDDVIGQMRLHGFPIPSERIRSIPLGTEHLDADQPATVPAELMARGFTVGSFALCLGVNYSHKNRELARAAHALVRARGFDLALVMAGASVPHGTTRVLEGRVAPSDATYVLPEVSSAERNWLLRHASLVWYPTSAEGFGLVPFEAAAFGTPTVAVGFGPVEELAFARSGLNRVFQAEVSASGGDGQLGDAMSFASLSARHEFDDESLRAPSTQEAFERNGATGRSDQHGTDVPMLARDWSPEALAEVAIAFLSDPDLARRHSAALNDAGRHYSWSRTADALVETFRESLSQPRR
jgi:glycosyltransferase involved in cell wall biosynthesis